MILKAELETTREAEKETQKSITFLKEHSYKSESFIESKEYLKAFKEEYLISRNLKWLQRFLSKQSKENENEIKNFKEEISISFLKNQCDRIEKMFQDELTDENEDFGED